MRIWRLEDGKPLGRLTGHTGPVSAVAVGALPDGTPVVVTGSRDLTVRIWRLEDGKPLGRLTGHTGPVRAVTIGATTDRSPVVVSSGQDRTVRAWRLQNGIELGSPFRTGSASDSPRRSR